VALGAAGDAGSRIPVSSPPSLAGEAVGKDHMLRGDRFEVGFGVEMASVSLRGGAGRWRPLRTLLWQRGGAGRTTRERGGLNMS
jgi:hypothetical protein